MCEVGDSFWGVGMGGLRTLGVYVIFRESVGAGKLGV